MDNRPPAPLRLTVSRWKQHGLDRLYVRTRDGGAVGYLDLTSSRSVLQRFDLRSDFDAAIQAWLDEHHAKVRASRPIQDLAGNRAGAAVRLKEEEMRNGNPLKRYADSLLGIDDAAAWRIGAEGEEIVARSLLSLPSTWHVLHSVPVGTRGSDIDHVLVGGSGVFTLNTKHHPGKRVHGNENAMTVGGEARDYAKLARFEATRASRMLSQACGFPVAVQGVVVFVSPEESFHIKAQPRDGKVAWIHHSELLDWLRSRPLALPPRWSAAVFEQARDAAIWA
jgi:hypothetical protein